MIEKGGRLRTTEYQNGRPPHDAAHQRIFKESRKPRLHDVDLFYALQFRSHPSNLEGYACDGRWRNDKALEMTDMVKVLEDWKNLAAHR